MTDRRHLLILDMDGTLVDSRRDITTALNEGLRAVGLPPLAQDRLVRHIGRPLLSIYRDLVGDADLAQAATDAYRAFFIAHCADHTRAFPGVMETLPDLHRLVFTSVGTTKRTYMAVKLAEQMGFLPFLDHVQGTDDFPAKPDPTLLLHLMARFGVPASRTVMVGDTPSDILAGRAAGAHTVAVSYGFGDAEALSASDPDFVVGDFRELPGLVRERFGLSL